MSTVKLGIAREKMNLAVRGEEIGDVDLRHFIGLSMLILRDSSKEPKIDVLTTSNKLLDYFRSTKWLFHEINEIKGRMNALEKRVNNQKEIDSGEGARANMGSMMDIAAFYKLEAKVQNLDGRVSGIENTLKALLIRALKS